MALHYCRNLDGIRKHVYPLKYIKIISIWGVLMAQGVLGFSQEGDLILNSFSAKQVAGEVYISCVISSGNTCNGIQIFRSEDGFKFDVIGNIAGVCGSSAGPVQYEYLDTNPKVNSVNYYQLDLGGVGNTTILEVDVRKLEDSQVQIAPNPMGSEGTLFFSNPKNTLLEVQISTFSGITIFTNTTHQSTLKIDAETWGSGLYLVFITDAYGAFIQTGTLVHY